eukprot:CAMPEP_0178995574 /NCGR_PEP_ID=MMETSP0795-20121207/7896_1 /TAXON_ID=88552 /ORGANISM="Amoebophrya sp., Strain Ameob2" /LENGTH=278 /DNA_ID=CAMNT_0020687883 /DNA_START=121 /DNA_END=957 /DNA_ORIENTATION=+
MSTPPPQLGAPAQEQMGDPRLQPEGESAGAAPRTPIFGGGRVEVKQILSKRSLIEVLTACDLNNRYDLFTNDGRQYYLKEDTDCLCRNCLRQHRAWKIQMLDTRTRDENAKVLYVATKDQVTCHDLPPVCMLDCCRPKMQVMNVGAGESAGRPIGQVQDPFNCCHVTERIVGEDGNDWYNISAHICSIGFWCPFCFGVDLPIRRAVGNGSSYQSGPEVGAFTKKAGGLTECCAGDLNTTIKIDLPGDCDTDDKKALLVMTGVLLDMTYFENNIKPKNK